MLNVYAISKKNIERMSKMGYYPEDDKKETQNDRIAELEARLQREEEEKKQRQNRKEKKAAVKAGIFYLV